MKRLFVAFCLALLPVTLLAETPQLQFQPVLKCTDPAVKDIKFAGPGPRGQGGSGVLPRSAGEHTFLDATALAGSEVELRYLLDRQLFLTETISLKNLKQPAAPENGHPAPKMVFELLAKQPSERKLLAEMSRRKAERVQVEIRQDGALLRSVSLAELRKESEALQKSPFRAEVVDSQVSGPGKREMRKMPAQLETDSCEYKEEYYWTGWYYVGWYTEPWNQQCFDDYIFYYYPGLWHVSVVDVFRNDQIKRTTHEDCSVTEELVGYAYLYFQCYDWTYSSCYNPWFPYNTCY